MSWKCGNCQNLIQTGHQRLIRGKEVFHVNKADCVKTSYLGGTLKEMREARNLSLKDIATHMGIRIWEVSNKERQIIDEATFKKFAEAIRIAQKLPRKPYRSRLPMAKRGKTSSENVRLREIRETLGITKTEMAIKLGISRATMLRYETGRFPAPTKIMNKAVKLLTGIIKGPEEGPARPLVGLFKPNPDMESLYRLERTGDGRGFIFVAVEDKLTDLKQQLQEYKDKFNKIKNLV